MIEKRIFYIISSCAIVLACWFTKNCFDAKVKADLVNAEKRVKLLEHYIGDFQLCQEDVLNKNSDILIRSIAFDEMGKIESDMRQDGYNGKEISSARSAGRKAAREFLEWLNH